mgnify:CR=1 FL=1
MAYTYNDPVIFAEYAIATAIACEARGIASVAVTAGYITREARTEFFEHIDAANVDLKAFTERFYWKLCGGHLEPVKETLQYLAHETDVWLEVTTLLIPGENDSAKEIERLSDWIAQRLGPHVPLHLTAFHGAWKMQDYPDTPADTLREARSIARRNGLKFVFSSDTYPNKWFVEHGQNADLLVHESFVTVELGENMKIKIQKHAIASVMPKGTIKSA